MLILMYSSNPLDQVIIIPSSIAWVEREKLDLFKCGTVATVSHY